MTLRAVVRYIRLMTGYKGGNLYWLIKRAKNRKLVRKKYKRHNPKRKYTARDMLSGRIWDGCILIKNW